MLDPTEASLLNTLYAAALPLTDHHSGSSMSHRGPLTAVITTVLGVTLGGLLVWRVYRRKRKPLPSVQKVDHPVEAPPPVEVSTAAQHQLNQPPALEKEWKATECQATVLPPAVQIPSSKQLLAVKPVTVSSEDEWQQLWPQMQRELSAYPVLGLDCEWVKTDAVRKSFCTFPQFISEEKIRRKRFICSFRYSCGNEKLTHLNQNIK